MLILPVLFLFAACSMPQQGQPSGDASPAASPMQTTPSPTATPAPPADDESGDTAAADADTAILATYSEARFDELQGNEKFALFFSAPWCPKCVATKNAIAEDPDQFAGVKLLDVDYDTATELKQQYGITLQHSFVFFDADGEVVGTSAMPSDDAVIAYFEDGIVPGSN